ncbi:MAG: macro domain-containing protein [Phycisphaerae bacterium]
MPLVEYRGNLFASRVQCLVNTVNCVGVMGKGVALEFRRRFPEMFEEYARICAAGQLRPGQILPYRKSSPWVLNFAVKGDWKFPSRLEWVEKCLTSFAANYRSLGVKSVAMPWLGAMNGGLDWPTVHRMIRASLDPLVDIEIELVEFDPAAPDPAFDRLVAATRSESRAEFASRTGIVPRAARGVVAAIETNVPSFARLAEMDGLGEKTIEALYARFAVKAGRGESALAQPTLFETSG